MTLRYKCQGHRVIFPEQPLVNQDFRTGGRYASHVQQMLDIIEVGSYNEKTALTMQFDIHTIPLAVNVAPDDQRIWGVHKHHNMRRPGVSPFIERPVLEDELGFITIQILRLRNSVMLLRAYGGQEIRGLPWMKPKDPDAAKRYWHENAFLARGYYMIKPNTTTLRVPDWYQPLSVKN